MNTYDLNRVPQGCNSNLHRYKIRKKYVNVFYGKFCLPRIPFSPLNLSHSNLLESSSDSDGVIYKKETKPSIQKVIVFDLDETLGSFGDLYILWAGIQHVFPKYSRFNHLLNLYPEFIRYEIYPILEFLYQKKKMGDCTKIYIYTNNQCPNIWVSNILQYFQTKIDIDHTSFPLFDNVIGAFKIRNKRIEISRTSHLKSYQDLIRCTLLPKSAEICFIDDTEYEQMKHDKIYYICPQSYIHSLSIKEIINRFIRSELWRDHSVNTEEPNAILNSEDYWKNWFKIHDRNDSEYTFVDARTIHLKIGQKIMYYIKDFFLLTTMHSRNSSSHTKKRRDTRRSRVRMRTTVRKRN
jgi:hypothetical protein